MRIRNAAVAGATALALTFGGSTVAFAQDAAPTNVENQSKTAPNGKADTTPEDYKASLSSKVGNWFDKGEDDNIHTGANGQAIFGSSKHENCDANETAECEHLADQPTWAKTAYGVGVASAVASVIGLIGVVYNFFVHGPSF